MPLSCKPNYGNVLACILLFALIFSGCKRELDKQHSDQPDNSPRGHLNVNPYSISNVRKAIQAVAERKHQPAVIQSSGQGRLAVNTATDTASYPTYVYFKFSPGNITQEQMTSLESDTIIHLMDIPFADASVYSDSTLDSTAIEGLKDGHVYAVAGADDPIVNTFLAATNLEAQVLDTLVLIPDTDTTLQSAALQQAGLSIDIFGICLFKQPHGYVRYWDQDLNNGNGQFEPVRNMQVWALIFGIPVHTYTDANGYYAISMRFSVGSLMGTKAKNSRVTIKPLDTHGSLVQAIGSLIVDFIAGSVHIDGWVSSCQMRDGKDFNYSGHTQVRLWCQLLNAYYFHDVYCAQEGIKNAPQGMTCYALWDNISNDFGTAGTPMLNSITGNNIIPNYINSIFGQAINTGFPNLFTILQSVLPDMYFKVRYTGEPLHYPARLAQLAFHELGHASQFRQVNAMWWLQLGLDELTSGDYINPYGTGNLPDDSRLSLAESWAEYIGTDFAHRRYPVGVAYTTDRTAHLNDILLPFSTLLEDENYFYGYSWMPCGLFHDLKDSYNGAEPWDNVSGVSIAQMYNTFSTSVNGWCDYANQFVNSYGSTFRASNIWQIFINSHRDCGTTLFTSAAINQNIQKNDCGAGRIGSIVNVTVPAGMFTSLTSQTDADQQAQAYAQTVANNNGSCTGTPVQLSATNTTNKTVNLKFTMLSTGTVYNYTVNPGTTISGTFPAGTYDVLMTPVNYSGTYPIVYSIDGIVQTYYATVLFGSYLINGNNCNVLLSPPPNRTINISNTTTKTMHYQFTNKTTGVTYNFTASPNGSLSVTVPEDAYDIFMVPDNYSTDYPVVYKFNNSTQVYYATVEFGSQLINNTCTVSTSPPPSVPINVSNSTPVSMTLKFVNLSTNYTYTFSASPGTSTPGVVPEGNYNVFMSPPIFGSHPTNVYTIYNSTQSYYSTVEFGGVNVTGTCPVSIHR